MKKCVQDGFLQDRECGVLHMHHPLHTSFRLHILQGHMGYMAQNLSPVQVRKRAYTATDHIKSMAQHKQQNYKYIVLTISQSTFYCCYKLFLFMK